jgi:hypothetical protein
MSFGRMLIQDSYQDNQVLNVDPSRRYIVNEEKDWQMLLNRNSKAFLREKELKIAAQLSPSDLTKIKTVAYLYNKKDSSAYMAIESKFRFYKISGPSWQEDFITEVTGAHLVNNFHFAEIETDDLVPCVLNGEDSIMIEAQIERKGVLYKDRIYLNHIGIYDSYLRNKKNIDFLRITKLDD